MSVGSPRSAIRGLRSDHVGQVSLYRRCQIGSGHRAACGPLCKRAVPIEEREGVLGGEAVFRNTRLSVRHIGKMFHGEQRGDPRRLSLPTQERRRIRAALLSGPSNSKPARRNTRSRTLLALLLLDENTSPRIVASLWHLQVSTVHIRDRGLLGAADHEIWKLANGRSHTIVTINGRDFMKLASRTEAHSGIIVIPSGGSADAQLTFIMSAVNWGAKRPIRPSVSPTDTWRWTRSD